MPMARLHAKRTAAEWRDDRDAANETEARLRRSQFDNIDIKAEVFVQARALFEMFDRLTQFGADPAYWIAQGDQPTTGICPARHCKTG
jgi:hypothetical protein